MRCNDGVGFNVSSLFTLVMYSFFLPYLGHLWEELRDDSLVPDALANTTTTFSIPIDHIQNHSLQASVNQTSQDIAIGLGKERVVLDGPLDSGEVAEQHHILYPMTYSGVESLAGYLTSCPTPITLI